MARYPGYAPEFRIAINGERIPAALRASVMSVTLQDGIEGADRVEITLANGLQWLDHPLLRVDNGLTLALGYAPGPLEEMFVGEITGVNASFPAAGAPTVTVVAHDFLNRTTRGTADRAFMLSLPCIGAFPLPDPAVAAIVSATNLLIPALDPVGAALSFLTSLVSFAIDPIEARKAVRIQQQQSDFDFLSKIARDNGWEMYIDHTLEPRGYVLRFSFLVQDYTPAVVLKWGESLIEFTPRISTVGQVIGVSTRIWISSIKTELVIVLGWDYDRAAFDLKVFPGIGSLDMLLGKTAAQSVVRVDAVGPATAAQSLLSELLPRLNNRLTGSGSAAGNPRIRAGKVIGFEGLGSEFSGSYRVTSATHTIDGSGYRTSFEGRKEVWFGSVPLPKGVSGLARVQGVRV